VTKRHRLIWRTALWCSVPAVLVAGILVARRQAAESPYVAGEEREGITRQLDRHLEDEACPIRFTEVTEAAGIRFRHFPFQRTSQLPEDMGSGAAWGDYDADGLPDLFLVNFAAPVGASDAELQASQATDRLFRNRGDGSFQDVTESSGVGRAHRGMGATWADFDADGDLDLFVTCYGNNVLWENRGDGSFRDVTRQAGLQGEGFWAGASWCDFDVDGDLDLYVCGYVQYEPEEPGSQASRAGSSEFPFTLNPSSYPPHPNRLYVNTGDGRFEESAEARGVFGDKGRSLGAAWADFDGDGAQDLYVANDVSDNLLLRNRGDGSFEDISYAALVSDYRGAMGIAVGDWDGDLDLDLFITHWIAQENALYSNITNTSEVASAAGLIFGDDADRVGLGQISLDLIGWGTAFVDLDNDTRLDLFVANGSTFQERHDPTKLVPMHPHLYWNRGASTGFYEVGDQAGLRTDPPGVGRGAAFADYDQDGDLDLVIVRHGGRARLLRNDSRSGDAVGLRIRAVSGPVAAFGSRLVVHAGGQSLLRQAAPGPSYLSQNDGDIHVGLGDASHIDSIEVWWPSGNREVWRDVAAGFLWRLDEGTAAQQLRAYERDAQPQPARSRRTSALSKHAIVADVQSQLSSEEKRQFWALSREAGSLFSQGEWSEAAAVFDKMSALDPSHEDALYYRGNCLLELGHYAEALASWERLRTLNPESSRAWVQIGLVHTIAGSGALYDLQAAAAAFETAHHINRESSGPLELWGEAAVALGDLDAAEKILASAYAMNPRATSALYLGGYIAWKRGDESRALELLQGAKRSLAVQAPVRGVLGEGDVRSERLNESRRRAAQRRLFAHCLADLRDWQEPFDVDLAFAPVDRVRSSLPEVP
jgi:tetratricopeptide (TPR) repeat protein